MSSSHRMCFVWTFNQLIGSNQFAKLLSSNSITFLSLMLTVINNLIIYLKVNKFQNSYMLTLEHLTHLASFLSHFVNNLLVLTNANPKHLWIAKLIFWFTISRISNKRNWCSFWETKSETLWHTYYVIIS